MCVHVDTIKRHLRVQTILWKLLNLLNKWNRMLYTKEHFDKMWSTEKETPTIWWWRRRMEEEKILYRKNVRSDRNGRKKSGCCEVCVFLYSVVINISPIQYKTSVFFWWQQNKFVFFSLRPTVLKLKIFLLYFRMKLRMDTIYSWWF